MAGDQGRVAVPVGEGWIAGPLDADVTVGLGADPGPLPAELDRIISHLWQEARRERPALFNGRVFSVDRITPARLIGHWTEYRRVLAQLRRPELFGELRLRPLAVNGLVECDDALLLGRRQADAVYLPSRWQAAPAGSVESRDGNETIDLAAQLVAELEEELGIGSSHIAAARPVLAVEHVGSHVVDVGFLLRVALPFASVEVAAAATGNREYEAFRPVGRFEVETVIAELGPALLPSARVLLRAWADRHAGR